MRRMLYTLSLDPLSLPLLFPTHQRRGVRKEIGFEAFLLADDVSMKALGGPSKAALKTQWRRDGLTMI